MDFVKMANNCFFRSMNEIVEYANCGTRVDGEILCLFSLVYLGLTLREAISLKTEQINIEKNKYVITFRELLLLVETTMPGRLSTNIKIAHPQWSIFYPHL